MSVAHLAKESLVAQSTYVCQLRSELPAQVFEPATSRLAFIPAHLAIIATSTFVIATGAVPYLLAPLLSLVIGVSFAGLAFVAHEGMHGGIVRGRAARQAIGWIGFLPFTISPRLWSAWHDRVHHANANLPHDPDVYPMLAEYRASRRVRFVIDAFSLGGRRWRGGLSLILGFTVQSAHQLARGRRFLSSRAHRIAIAQTLAGVGVWTTVALVVGFLPFLFVYVVPLLVANAIVMSFILTNHGLSPRVEANDPLASGLSVTVPRWLEWVTLNFGYHVEHHVFPAMSSRHAPRVRDLLRQHWPTRYQSMPLRMALGALYRTARVYKDAVTLIDPRTSEEYPTLVPR
jgi:fatty acid desaturase